MSKSTEVSFRDLSSNGIVEEPKHGSAVKSRNMNAILEDKHVDTIQIVSILFISASLSPL